MRHRARNLPLNPHPKEISKMKTPSVILPLILVIASSGCEHPIPRLIHTKTFSSLSAYPDSNLIDRNLNTAWCQDYEQNPDSHDGNFIAATPYGNNNVFPGFMHIFIGLSDPHTYPQFDRPRKIALSFGREGHEIMSKEFTLIDSVQPQRLEMVEGKGEIFDQLVLRLRTDAVFPGKTHRNICISELTFLPIVK